MFISLFTEYILQKWSAPLLCVWNPQQWKQILSSVGIWSSVWLFNTEQDEQCNLFWPQSFLSSLSTLTPHQVQKPYLPCHIFSLRSRLFSFVILPSLFPYMIHLSISRFLTFSACSSLCWLPTFHLAHSGSLALCMWNPKKSWFKLSGACRKCLTCMHTFKIQMCRGMSSVLLSWKVFYLLFWEREGARMKYAYYYMMPYKAWWGYKVQHWL